MHAFCHLIDVLFFIQLYVVYDISFPWIWIDRIRDMNRCEERKARQGKAGFEISRDWNGMAGRDSTDMRYGCLDSVFGLQSTTLILRHKLETSQY
jgi:hypothetical protein